MESGSERSARSGDGPPTTGRRLGNPHVAGNPVGGSDAFVGREDVLRAVFRALAEPLNQGIVLYGQRRIGKTSILQHLKLTLLERSGHQPVWFDLQDKAAESLGQVLTDLAAEIAAALRLPRPRPGPAVETWFGETWLPRVLAKLPPDVSLVLLFDEFDVLADVQAKKAASALFACLRRLLEKHAPRLRAVFVIGRNIDDLENVAHALFKGMPSYQVSLLARKDAEALVRLAEGNGSLTWSDEAVEAAWALTHGHPLLLQALCSHVWVHAHEERRPEDAAQPVTAVEVDAAVEPTLSGSRPALEWLWKGLPPGKRVVAAALAQAGPGAIAKEALQRVLNENGVRVIIRELREAPRMLIEWDLLEAPAKDLYHFRVELLRRWIERFKPLERVLEELDQIEPTAELIYRAAESHYREGQLDPAMAKLQETLGLNPNHVRARELLADIWISRQDWREARAVLERLYDNHPAVARARLVEVLLVLAEAAPGEDEELALFQQVREVEANAVAIAGIRRIWKARGDRARAGGHLEGAREAYRHGGLTELEADVTRDIQERLRALREEQLAAALEQVAALDAREAYAEAIARVRSLADDFGDIWDWRGHLTRLEGAARLDETYRRALGSLGREDKQPAKDLLASVIGQRPDHEGALTRLYVLITGQSVPNLQAEARTLRSRCSHLSAELHALRLERDHLRSRAAAMGVERSPFARPQEAGREVLGRARNLGDDFDDVRSWPADLARLEETARLSDDYRRGVEALGRGDGDAAKAAFAAVIAHSPDHESALSRLHALVLGVSPLALRAEIRVVGLLCVQLNAEIMLVRAERDRLRVLVPMTTSQRPSRSPGFSGQ